MATFDHSESFSGPGERGGVKNKRDADSFNIDEIFRLMVFISSLSLDVIIFFSGNFDVDMPTAYFSVVFSSMF